MVRSHLMKATVPATGNHLIKACLLIFLGIHGVYAGESINRLTESEERSGWKLLFDGTSLDGFKGYQQDTPGSGWHVIDGAIVRTESAGDLLTKKCTTVLKFNLNIEYVRQGIVG